MTYEDMITYCGGYGGICAGCLAYPHQRKLANIFAEWLDASGCGAWMPEAVDDFDYIEFRKGLDYFSSEDSPPRCRSCCRGGSGRPDCEVRKCCQERKLFICAECSDYPCGKLTPKMIERLMEYKKLGKELWLKKYMRLAEQGYEGHTEKYYRFHADNIPPKVE